MLPRQYKAKQYSDHMPVLKIALYLHSQKEKLKLCMLSTYIEIFMFLHRIEVQNLPNIQCSSFLPCFEVVFAHTIIGI